MPSGNKKDFSSKIVISAIIAVIGYTLIHLVFVWFDKYIPAQLTISWFSFWGVEIGALAGIEVTKRRTGIPADIMDYQQSNKY